MNNKFNEGVVAYWSHNSGIGIITTASGGRVDFDLRTFRVPLVDRQLRKVFYLWKEDVRPAKPYPGWKVLFELNGDTSTVSMWGWKEAFVMALTEVMAKKPVIDPCGYCGHSASLHRFAGACRAESCTCISYYSQIEDEPDDLEEDEDICPICLQDDLVCTCDTHEYN